ncbi:phosphatidylinositol-glycan biosynthesis class F protein-like [Homarus americanus]|uniref:Phosphatidylinositol-glycan biosynthesis class F protein-like n=1 Tax=Homarus americanus TaxID=6706 RepID=A0A8J5JVD1_HOMAM|nr:phosphatidylinositol-glycan biosynthesis class F protein-like [Homarus americanus]KAG7165092.1 Phosphatidylinositol-glycan biosynthesis class F protein-like [Homarus americanus]
MLSSASRDPPPSLLLSCKPAVSFILGAILLCYLVQSHYQHDVCLHALRVYSFAVIGLEICFRILGVCVLTGSWDSYLGGPSKGKTKKSSKVVDVFLIAVWSVLSIILTHIVTVLYGAYLIEYVEETFTFSILVAALSFIRPLIALGPSAIVIILERLNWEKESEVHCFAVLLGAWLGAIPIPLDWDTPWQVWPLTCSIGAVLGELGACMYLLVKLWKEGDISRKKNKAT